MNDFIVNTRNHLSYLTFSPFERLPFLKHAFSMRLTYPPLPAEHRPLPDVRNEGNNTEQDFLEALGIPLESLVTLQQVHGNQCQKVFRSQLKQIQGTAGDSLLTSDHGIALGVRTADCFPVLMLEPERKAISCTHAGWRSLANRILDNCLELMIKDFSCHPSSIVAAIGPGIDKCCYKVREDVLKEFEKSRISVQSFISQAEDDSFYLDLKAVIIEQLSLHGLSQNHIHPSSLCTFCSPLPLPSFRKEGRQAGRILSVIMLSEKDTNAP